MKLSRVKTDGCWFSLACEDEARIVFVEGLVEPGLMIGSVRLHARTGAERTEKHTTEYEYDYHDRQIITQQL